MATLKFMKVASSVRLKCLPQQPDKPSEVNHLKDEVKFLKDILHLKRFGGGFSELAFKVKALQKENQDLKRRILPQDRIELILQQNFHLKKELDVMNSRKQIISREGGQSDAEDLLSDGGQRSRLPRNSPNMKQRTEPSLFEIPGDGDSDRVDTGLRQRNSENAVMKTSILFSEKLPIIARYHRSQKGETHGDQTQTENQGSDQLREGSEELSPTLPLKRNNFVGSDLSRNKSTSSYNSEQGPKNHSPDRFIGSDLNPGYQNRRSQPLKIFKTNQRPSQQASRGSPSNFREYQGILDLIEDHIARKSDGNRLKTATQPVRHFFKPIRGSGSQDHDGEPARNAGHSARSGSRSRDILRQIQLMSSHQKDAFASPSKKERQPKTFPEVARQDVTPKIYFNITPSKILKLSFKNSKPLEDQQLIPPSTRFSFSKYDQSLRNIKREMDRITFE